ncbi:CS1 type fimbrial major subunit [Pseudomonas sp. Xaverov 259]|uniref:CS1 type fimbrial major subunit n=1 Tax=Pseudomonas sp. Xaverov 259 TaxID=2666086 RepID=UPI001C5A79B2|nr:CS1 type fimbrial major subunit [Pseudomonas sp. Xaverov 259]
MFKKIAIAVPMTLLALASTGVFAAGEAAHSIQLTAHVPTTSFYVQPVNSDVVNVPQVLVYDAISSTFKPLVESFDTKNTAGSIHASIEQATTYLFNGSTKIDLDVEFNGVKLGATPVQVVTAQNALTGSRVVLEITPVAAPSTGYVPGDYTGTVAMTFDSVI